MTPFAAALWVLDIAPQTTGAFKVTVEVNVFPPLNVCVAVRLAPLAAAEQVPPVILPLLVVIGEKVSPDGQLEEIPIIPSIWLWRDAVDV
jgi:hypothetical protein